MFFSHFGLKNSLTDNTRSLAALTEQQVVFRESLLNLCEIRFFKKTKSNVDLILIQIIAWNIRYYSFNFSRIF